MKTSSYSVILTEALPMNSHIVPRLVPRMDMGTKFQEDFVHSLPGYRGHRSWKLQSAYLLVWTIVDDHVKIRRYGEGFSGQRRSVFCAQLIGIDLAEQSCCERDAHENRNPGSPPDRHEFRIL